MIFERAPPCTMHQSSLRCIASRSEARRGSPVPLTAFGYRACTSRVLGFLVGISWLGIMDDLRTAFRQGEYSFPVSV
jgi:hypothetical protein